MPKEIELHHLPEQNDKYTPPAGRQYVSFSSEHVLFLLRLENNLNKAGINYQYYYDYVVGSLICPEITTNDMPEEPY